jgi:hypothetical protein
MKPWEKYSAAEPVEAATPAEAGPWAKYQESEAKPTAQTLAVRKAEEERSKGTFRQNLAAGLVRGAGSIGATLMWPIDKATDLIQGDRDPNLTGLVTGQQPISRNEERRQAMTQTLQDWGANPESLAFKGGKIGGEIAGTAGVGGAIANVAGRTGMVAPSLVKAIRSGGMAANGAGMLPRVAGGAITGGASAGLVDPSQAGMGAVVGGALPVATKVAGAAGNKIGQFFRGPDQPADVAAAVQAARSQGYVIPPTQARPTALNRLAEGFSGKLTTAQNASAKNQAVTNQLSATALGLPADTKLTPEVLNAVRNDAGSVYREIKTLGNMTGDAKFNNQMAGLKGAFEGAAKDFPGLAKPELSQMLDSLKSPTFKASSAVDAIRLLRESADKAFSAGDKGTAKALRQASAAMEDLIERNLLRMNAKASLDSILKNNGTVGDIGAAAVSNPASGMLDSFRSARQLIAKTYSIEKALNPATGTVDARKLATQLAKGKPLSGELKNIADFASRFPKASQPVEMMGSLPQMSPLDWAASGGVSAATGNPLMMAGVLARPAARKMILSDFAQNRLIQPPRLPQSQSIQSLIQAGYRTAPVIAADR